MAVKMSRLNELCRNDGDLGNADDGGDIYSDRVMGLGIGKL